MDCNVALIFGDIDNKQHIDAKEKYFYSNIDKVKYDNSLWHEVKSLIEEKEIDSIIASSNYINIVSRLLWECNCIKQYFLTDSEDALICEKMNERANALMWDSIAMRTSNDIEDVEIKQTGWISSFSGNYFSKEEMQEYSSNTLNKLKPYCTENTNVLEIGVASGITCSVIAPIVKKYIGVDISTETLKKTQSRLHNKNINNVTLLQGDAGKIDKLRLQEKIDVVIINSVAQYFPGYNYFINVLKSLMKYMSDSGIIYVGDVMDLSKREEFQHRLVKSGKKSNRNDLYYPKTFMNEMQAYFENITKVIITDKIGKIENELTLYRYDVIFEIDKSKRIVFLTQKWGIYYKNGGKVLKVNKKIEEILIQCGIEEDMVHCDNFVSEDILDSLTMAEIIIELEDLFCIEIDAEEIIPENFINIDTISKLVEKYLK